MTKQTFCKKAFTLVEVLITIIIIGILAGALMLSMANVRDKAEAAKVVSNLRNLKSAAVSYCLDNGGIPDTRGSQGWSMLSATVLQPYLDIDLSKYGLLDINPDGISINYDDNVKTGYILYIMGDGETTYSSKVGKLIFVAAWVGDKSMGTKKALESMAHSTPLFNGNYTEYVGQQKTGPLPYYTADPSNDLNKNSIVMRVY